MTSLHPAQDSLLEFADRTDNPRLMQIILRHMEGLRRSIDGDELYALIARVLRKHGRAGTIGNAAFVELYHQLDAYARDPITLGATRIKAKLLQQHIEPYMPDQPAETDAPASTLAHVATNISFGGMSVSSAPLRKMPVSLEPAPMNTLDVAQDISIGDPEPHPDTMRRSEQHAWRAIYDTMRDFGALKKLWTTRLEELSQERNQLERRLTETEQQLKSVETENEKLRAELESARRMPARKAPRRLTKLSRNGAGRLITREQFVQQLQAEISRVKRTGGSIALALLGIEDLQRIGENYGDGIESVVLDCYTREILTGFRAHDIIGRYDDEAFAILFPDTAQDGAYRALEKAQKRAAETHVQRNGSRFPLPGFFGTLTIYTQGEEPVSWLQRAEESLANARAQDGERLIVS